MEISIALNLVLWGNRNTAVNTNDIISRTALGLPVHNSVQLCVIPLRPTFDSASIGVRQFPTTHNEPLTWVAELPPSDHCELLVMTSGTGLGPLLNLKSIPASLPHPHQWQHNAIAHGRTRSGFNSDSHPDSYFSCGSIGSSS